MLVGNYFKSAIRNLLGHKLFSVINIFGLAIGLAAVMLITMFVRDELSYDTFWDNAENIYRPQFVGSVPGMEVVKFVNMPLILRESFMRDFPQVTHATRMLQGNPSVKIGDDTFQQEIMLTDSDIIDIFSFDLVAGSFDNLFDNNNDIIVTRSVAEKYFGIEEAIGKIIPMDFDTFERDYRIRAVIEDTPPNSQLEFHVIGLLNEDDYRNNGDSGLLTNWLALSSYFYYTLEDGSDIEIINDQMPDFIDRNFIAFAGGPVEKESEAIQIKSLNIRDLHLLAEGSGEMRPKGNMTTVIIFSAVSLLILIIAGINFMNLSTARAGMRAREVSMRKVLGASRKHLIIQFLGESILLSIISLVIATLFVELTLPLYNDMIGKSLAIDYLSADLLQILGLALSIGVVAGIYPAFFLSSFRPAHILKANQSVETKSSSNLRSVLVILQFAVSIALFVSTAVVYGQMKYATDMEYGYNEENLMLVYTGNRDAVTDVTDFLLNEMKRQPNIVNATASYMMPGRGGENISSYRTADMPRDDSTIINYTGIGYDFFETYGVELLAGRYYDRDRPDDMASTDEIREGASPRGAMIINQSGLSRFGLGTPEEAIGKFLYQNVGDDEENLQREYEIIGVIPDVYFDTLKKEIRPEVFELTPENHVVFSIRFSGDPQAAVDTVRNVWMQTVPTVEFDYEHVIDRLIRQYEKEQGEMTMFATFSALAIFIACLGLFGLASFTAERRTKEIGIRKVFGAEIVQIIRLLLWQFSKPVLIANLIAWPVAYLAMSGWLENFAYRIGDMAIIALCLLAGLSALLIAWATVAGNSYSVARQNPIKALRYE